MARISNFSKVNALNEAIAFLQSYESESDEAGDKDAREWLANKLDREADRIVVASGKTKGGQLANRLIEALLDDQD